MAPAAGISSNERRFPASRLLAGAFILLCAILYFKQNILDPIPTRAPNDFRFYYFAAQHIRHGESPFLTQDYIYPPLLAYLLTPLAGLDYLTARWIWFLISQACFLAAAYLMWQRMRRDWLAASVIAFVWAAGMAAQDSFGTGQPDTLITLLMVVACARTGWAQGAAAGAGFAVKLIPGVLGMLLPLERNWRALLALISSAALLTVLPWALVAFLRGPARPANTDYLAGTPCVLSWSIPSVTLRIFEPPGPNGKLPAVWDTGWDLPKLRLSLAQKLISLSVALAILAAGIAVLTHRVRGRLTADQVPIAGTALIALSLAASPISWWHYQTMQYPGVALLLCDALRRRQWRLFCAALCCAAALFPVPATVLRFYYHQHERWPDSPAIMYFWTSVTPLASLVLFGLLVSRLWIAKQPGRQKAAGMIGA